MKLTFKSRLLIILEVIFARPGGPGHIAQEKQLSTFLRGYEAGMKDKLLEIESTGYKPAERRRTDYGLGEQ